MSQKAKEGGKGGLFSFRANLAEMGDLSPRIKELERQLEALPKGREGRHERRKIQKDLDELRAKSRRAFLKVLGGGGVIAGVAATVGGAALLASRKSPEGNVDTGEGSDHDGLSGSKEAAAPVIPEGIGIKEFTNIEPAKLTSQEEFMRMVELQEYWKRISQEALEHFKDADPSVKQLADFMKKYAFYSIPVGPVATRTISLGKHDEMPKDDPHLDPHGFEVVYMPEQYARDMKGPILTEEGGKTMRMATNFRCKEWLGIMLAHELKHVHDQLVEGENARDPRQYNLGEVRAHLFEMNLLRAWDPKTYDFLIEKGIPLYKEALKTNNIMPLARFIENLYPVGHQVSPAEGQLGLASCIMAVAFAEAQSRGASEEDLVAVYLYLRNNFGRRPQ